MMYCDYREHSGQWICSICGDVRKRPVTRNCPLIPRRSDADVEHNRSICQSCPRYTGTRCFLTTGGCEESRINLWTFWLRRGRCPEGRW